MALLRQDGALPEASVHDFGRDLLAALQVCVECESSWLVDVMSVDVLARDTRR